MTTCAIDGCASPSRRKGLCEKHYSRQYRASKAKPRKTLADRFSEKYIQDAKTECWEWHGWKDAKGYGRFWCVDRMVSAHRFSYEHHRGEITDGQQVLHRCDNPGCINPDQLFLGTHLDNMADMRQKGRRSASERLLRGERSPSSKLTNASVAVIKRRLAAGDRCSDIARDIGCDRTNVSLIKHGKIWRDHESV